MVCLISPSFLSESVSLPPGRYCEDLVRTCELLLALWIKLELGDVAIAVTYFICRKSENRSDCFGREGEVLCDKWNIKKVG